MRTHVARICAVTVSVLSLLFAPQPVLAFDEDQQACTIHCSYCGCNATTGICECRNCTIDCPAS